MTNWKGEVRAGADVNTYGDWKILGPANRAAVALAMFFVQEPSDRAELEIRIGQRVRAVTFDPAIATTDRNQRMQLAVNQGEEISVRLASRLPGDRAVVRVALV